MSRVEQALAGRNAVFVALFMLAYAGARYAGSLVFVEPQHIVMLWPASGVLVAALLLKSVRLWPLLLAGALAVQLPFDTLIYGETLGYSLAIAAANLVEALVGAALIRWVVGSRFYRSELVQVIGITIFAAGVGAALGAGIGALATVMRDPAEAFWVTWRGWWAANALGIFLVAPFILFWFRPIGRDIWSKYAGRGIEIALLLVGVLGSAVYVFSGVPGGVGSSYELPYLGFPFMIWLVLRFDARLAAAAMLLLGAVIVAYTALGSGPYAGLGYLGEEQLFTPQLFLSVRAFLVIAVAALVTDRRRALARLKASETALRARVHELEDAQRAVRFAENLADSYLRQTAAPSLRIHRDGRMDSINPAALELLGGEASDLVGKDWFELCVPDDLRVQRRATFKRWMDGGIALRSPLELEIVNLKGERRVCVWHFEMVGDGNGRPDGIFSSGVDITEQRLAEERAKERARTAQFLERIADIAHRSANLDDAVKRTMAEVCAFTGWEAGHLYRVRKEARVPLLSTSLWHLPEGHQLAPFVKNREAANFPLDMGLPGSAYAAGGPVWVPDITEIAEVPRTRIAIGCGIRSAIAVPILVDTEIVAVLEFFSLRMQPADDKILAALKTVGVQLGRVVERQRIEEYRQFLVAILGSIEDEIVTCDAEGVLTNTDNPEGVVNRVAQPVPPEKWAEHFGLYHADGVTLMKAEEVPLYRAWRGEVVKGIEMVSKKADGTTRRQMVSGGPMRDYAGKPLGAVVSMHDVTQMKAMEVQLRQAQKMEAVGQLTSGIAHDFNNILAVVMGNIEMAIERGAQGKDISRYLALAQAGAQQGADINRRLLAFSRHQVFEEKLQDINALMSSVTELIGRALGESIEIETLLCDEPCFSVVDPAQLESAILNLALNARDAMPSGGRLGLETAIVSGDDGEAANAGEQVRITVRDSGMGMSKEVLDRAIEPFFSTKAAGSGSGLGLSMVYNFVDLAGGGLDIESAPGKGTAINLYLPRATANKQAEASVAPASDSIDGDGELVLVVEDQDDVRQLVCNFLDNLGYRFEAARNGAEALEKVERLGERVAVVLTDVMMPGHLDGAQLIAALRKKWPRIRTLMMSGNPTTSEKGTGSVGGDFILLRKPFRKTELAQALKECLAAPGERAAE